jgi:hypothetical protein
MGPVRKLSLYCQYRHSLNVEAVGLDTGFGSRVAVKAAHDLLRLVLHISKPALGLHIGRC